MIGFIQDISPLFKKKELSFLNSHQEAENVYSFIFEKEDDLNWKAGQHGVFSIIHKGLKSQHGHSVWHLLLQRVSSK